jgi:hypothetical protein
MQKGLWQIDQYRGSTKQSQLADVYREGRGAGKPAAESLLRLIAPNKPNLPRIHRRRYQPTGPKTTAASGAKCAKQSQSRRSEACGQGAVVLSPSSLEGRQRAPACQIGIWTGVLRGRKCLLGFGLAVSPVRHGFC